MLTDGEQTARPMAQRFPSPAFCTLLGGLVLPKQIKKACVGPDPTSYLIASLSLPPVDKDVLAFPACWLRERGGSQWCSISSFSCALTMLPLICSLPEGWHLWLPFQGFRGSVQAALSLGQVLSLAAWIPKQG